jgi:hypothetical protein
MAQTAASSEQRKILLELAHEWEAMVEQAERLEQLRAKAATRKRDSA